MAFISMNVLSQCLMRTVNVNVILPADKMVTHENPVREEKQYKTLYLLHGVLGSNVDWVNGTRIQRYAEENDLAVVMPSGENSFYVDQPAQHNYYGEFVGRELVEISRRMFPLSHKREDTFIGGLSMGGYGALRNGLKYSDTFGTIISLSGALNLDEMAAGTEEKERFSALFFEGKSFIKARFGSLDKILESDKDPRWFIRRLSESGQSIPDIYMACGNKDSFLEANRNMYEFFKDEGVKVNFETGEGGHDWDFWDTYIKKAVYEWLPTEGCTQGVNSGNVGI